MYKCLPIIVAIAVASCANFNPEQDSYMKSCEIVVGLEEVQNDIFKGYVADLDGRFLRLTAYAYDCKDSSLLYTHNEFYTLDQNEVVLHIPLLDASIERRIVLIADIVTLNDFGDAYSDCSFLWTSSYDSLCMSVYGELYSVDNAYYADFTMIPGEVSHKAKVSDCFKDIDLVIVNALHINKIELNSRDESYFYFADKEPQYVTSTIDIIRPGADTVKYHLKHLGMSDSTLSIFTQEDYQFIDLKGDVREVSILYDSLEQTYKLNAYD